MTKHLILPLNNSLLKKKKKRRKREKKQKYLPSSRRMRNTHESYLNVMHISVPYRLTYFRFPFIYRLSRQSFPLYRQDESSSNKSSRFTFKPRYLVIYDLRERMPEFSTDYPFFFFRSRRKCARTKSPARFNAVGRNVA